MDTAGISWSAFAFGFSVTVVVAFIAAVTGWVMSRLAALFNP
jgi:hypothetical protein